MKFEILNGSEGKMREREKGRREKIERTHGKCGIMFIGKSK